MGCQRTEMSRLLWKLEKDWFLYPCCVRDGNRMNHNAMGELVKRNPFISSRCDAIKGKYGIRDGVESRLSSTLRVLVQHFHTQLALVCTTTALDPTHRHHKRSQRSTNWRENFTLYCSVTFPPSLPQHSSMIKNLIKIWNSIILLCLRIHSINDSVLKAIATRCAATCLVEEENETKLNLR